MPFQNEKKASVQRFLSILFIFILIALSLYRVYLMLYANWYMILTSAVDDEMQVNNAIALLKGEWMGAYSNATIAKGPSYPLFVAAFSALGISYPIAYAGFILFSSAIFAIAIRPLQESRLVRGLIYLFLIYNPIGLNQHFSMRIYRQALIPWAVLLVVACVAGLFLRRERRPLALFPWSLGAACAAAFFWYLREDSIWMLPFLVAGLGITGICQVLDAQKPIPFGRIVAGLFLLALPFIGILSAKFGISLKNKLEYGVFETEDRVESSIGDVMKCLYRIEDGMDWSDRDEDAPTIWVSSKAIQLAQEASPALAQLDSLMECYYELSLGKELWADWPEWALRNAAAERGYYREALNTEIFFAIAADELEQAFADGRLTKKEGIYLSSQTGAFSTEDFSEAWEIAGVTLENLFSFTFCRMEPLEVSYYDEEKLTDWERLLHIRVPRTEEQLAALGADDAAIAENAKLQAAYDTNVDLANGVNDLYQSIWGLFAALLIAGYLLGVCWLIARRTKAPRFVFDAWLLMTGVFLTCLLNVCIVSLFTKALTNNPLADAFCFYSLSGYVTLAAAEAMGLCLLTRLAEAMFSTAWQRKAKRTKE